MITLAQIQDNLVRRGYEAHVCSPEQAIEYCRGVFERVQSVGWGGSESVKELGLREIAADMGKEIRDHRTDCDVFLLSANALTCDGRIVNVDGTGNRVAASIYGPKRVVYVIGRNKIVAGGYKDALARIHLMACPPNCRRLGKDTPCASGKCPWFVNGLGCESPDRICKVTVVFDRAPTRTPTTVLLVDHQLGF